MINRIHIFGASGSGATTLGRELSEVLPHTLFDGDDYFWIEKFDKMREARERVELLKEDLSNKNQWILSGAVCGWGDELKSFFDVVIYLYVPQDIRVNRLKAREFFRYGDEVLPGGRKYEQSQTFLDWALLYDTAGMEARSRVLHEHWMSGLSCPILIIEGDHSVKERVGMVIDYLNSHKS